MEITVWMIFHEKCIIYGIITGCQKENASNTYNGFLRIHWNNTTEITKSKKITLDTYKNDKYIVCPTGNYLFKVNNEDFRTVFNICP